MSHSNWLRLEILKVLKMRIQIWKETEIGWTDLEKSRFEDKWWKSSSKLMDFWCKNGISSVRVSLLVMYQGGPPSAHATLIRLPNGQFVTHKPIYFDTRKLRNHTLYDFLDGKTQLYTSGICSISGSSVTSSQQWNYHEQKLKIIIGHINLSIPTPGNQEVQLQHRFSLWNQNRIKF